MKAVFPSRSFSIYGLGDLEIDFCRHVGVRIAVGGRGLLIRLILRLSLAFVFFRFMLVVFRLFIQPLFFLRGASDVLVSGYCVHDRVPLNFVQSDEAL